MTTRHITCLLLQTYLSGLALGASICGMHCSILLAPLVARGGANWKEGIRMALMFGAGKVPVYAILGGIASYSGYLIQDVIARGFFALAGGTVLIGMGLWFLFYHGKCGRFCTTGPPLLLGAVDGIFPCGPMLGLMLYLAYAGHGVGFGIAGGALFALGTVTGPVLAVCGITPYLWRKISRFRKAPFVLRLVGAAIFVLWGITLLIGGATGSL